jgi:long-chain fatty acid transport protein
MRKTKILIIAAAVALLVPTSLFASGFGYYEHGAKATGMAGAFVAQADDVSAIYYNPAGIAFLEGTNIMGAFHPVKPESDAIFMGVRTEGETDWLPPASGYMAMNLTSNIKVGLGVFFPYGLEVVWPDNWMASAISSRSYMKTMYVRPTVAFKVNDNFAIGIGLDYASSDLELEQQSDFSVSPLLPSGRVDTAIAGDGDGWGFTVGALAKLSEKFQVGFKYQHEIEIDYEGDADFSYTAAGHPLVDGAAALLLTDQSVTTSITMPWELVVGAMFKASDDLTMEFDFQYTGWSSYETLEILFANPMLNTGDEGDWDDTYMIRVGGQYDVAREWALRAGYIYDTSPIPDSTLKPILPGADRNEFTLGIGYNSKEACCWGRVTFDAAIQYLMFDDRTSTFPEFPADYESTALIFGAGIGITFF